MNALQAQHELQSILAGALHVRVATEVLHPLFRLYVPKLSEGICSRPGIIVISKPNDPPVLLADVDTCGMQCITLDHQAGLTMSGICQTNTEHAVHTHRLMQD